MKKVIYSFIFLFCAVLTLQAETMVVATYNLRNANGGDSTNGNGWGQRYPYIAQIVQFHGFDIFGTQEGKYPQLQDLRQAMPGYDYIGVGRDDGKLGVCLDTCHVYSAGYDIVNGLDSVLEHFDAVLGLERLRAIHLNDSMTPFSSFKDRHETIGKGSLGEQAFINIINHPVLRELPFFLETPRDDAGHGEEITWLKEHYRN